MLLEREEFEEPNKSLRFLLLWRAESEALSFLKRDENGDPKSSVEASEVLLRVRLEGGFAVSDASGSLAIGASDESVETFDVRDESDEDE